MALDSEIDRVRKDPVQWRSIAERLLIYADGGGLKEGGERFLRGVLHDMGERPLNYRQCELLLIIRDDLITVSIYRGCSIKRLIKLCYENRLDIQDEDDEAMVIDLYRIGRTSIRKTDAHNLWRIARNAGALDYDWAA